MSCFVAFSDVFVPVAILGEGSPTDLTLVGFLPSVNSQMFFHIRSFTDDFRAEDAFVLDDASQRFVRVVFNGVQTIWSTLP